MNQEGQPVGVGAALLVPPQVRPNTRFLAVIARSTGHQLRCP